MSNLKDFLGECRILFSYPKHIIILLARLVIAYGFAVPALVKINDLEGTTKWFESISIPLPTLAAYLVSGIETMGIILLILGLFTRYISILLGFVMLGAILFVHLGHGFSVVNNGIEIPLYYFIFLMLFASFGGGKYSLDRLLFQEERNE
jgi:putative oxidoreductase